MLSRLISPHWRLITIGIISIVLVNLLEAVLPYLLKIALDRIQAGETSSELLKLSLIYLAVAGVQMCCRVGWRISLALAGTRLAHELRVKVSHQIARLSQKNLQKRTTGDLISLNTSDTEAVRGIIDPGIMVFGDAACGVLFLPFMMFYISPSLTMVGLAPLIFLPLLLRRIEKQIAERFTDSQGKLGKLSGLAFQDLTALRVIKSFNKEAGFLKRFSKSSHAYASSVISTVGAELKLVGAIEFLAAIGAILCLLWAIPGVIDQTITVGSLVALQQYLRKLMWPLEAIGFGTTLLQKARASAERIQQLLNLKTEDLQTGENYTPGAIAIQNLSFAYPDSQAFALQNINLKIQPGERVAILGETGSGKSTLFSLLLRVYEPSSGEISINSQAIQKLKLYQLRAALRLTPQDPVLFNTTIGENVAPGSAAATNLDLTTSLQRAGLSSDMVNLPAGQETAVGESGRAVSGGQRQRIALARALFNDPQVLLLDDPFSALDTHTAAMIVDALQALPQKPTIIFTTQRLAALRLADRIVVLQNGRITEEGTHRELLAIQGSWYANFVKHGQIMEALDAS